MKKRNLIAVWMSIVLASTTTAAMPSFAAADLPHEITEEEAIAYLCTELCIDDWDAYVADFAAKISVEKQRGMNDTDPFDPAYYIDIYTGGNSNGVIDVLDATYLSKFLNGEINYPYSFTDLDPTQDHIIDKSDVFALLACYNYHVLLEEHPEFVPGTHGNSNEQYSTQDRSYKKYNASSGNLITSYTLYAVNNTSLQMSSNNSISNKVLLNNPSRMVSSSIGVPRTQFANDNIRIGSVKIITQTGNSFSWRSGSIIDNHTIATCAHTTDFAGSIIKEIRLYDTAGNRVYKDPNNLNDDFTPIEYHIPDNYSSITTNDRFWYDYAMITVAEDLGNYSHMSLGFPLDEYISTESSVSITGYPHYNNPLSIGSPVNNTTYLNARYCSSGNLISNPNNPNNNPGIDITYMLFSNYPRIGGFSGSPVYFSYSYTDQNNTIQTAETVIGIHSGTMSSYSSAPRVTMDLLQFYLNNCCKSIQ